MGNVARIELAVVVPEHAEQRPWQYAEALKSVALNYGLPVDRCHVRLVDELDPRDRPMFPRTMADIAADAVAWGEMSESAVEPQHEDDGDPAVWGITMLLAIAVVIVVGVMVYAWVVSS